MAMPGESYGGKLNEGEKKQPATSKTGSQLFETPISFPIYSKSTLKSW
jgi:hypothetical protein